MEKILMSELRLDADVKFESYEKIDESEVNFRNPETFRQCIEDVDRLFPNIESLQ